MKALVIPQIAVIAIMAGCSAGNHPGQGAEPVFPQDPNGNLVLYVSNQSYAITPVDITVHIDGKMAIQNDFDVGGQHRWVQHVFRVTPGEHTLKVVSRKGKASLETRFDLKDKHWAVVYYGYYPKATGGTGPTPKSFSFQIEDKPIGFV